MTGSFTPAYSVSKRTGSDGPTAKVRALAEAAADAGDTRVMERGDNPTEGSLVPLAKLVA
jgi:hypothetical protein